MNTAANLLLAACAALVLAGASLLDGAPSDHELAEAVALDVKDAQAQAARESRTVRAELAATEPTPADILRQYAALSGVVK